MDSQDISQPSSPLTPISVDQLEPTINKSKFTIPALLLLVFILSCTTTYLIYQNIRLRKIISSSEIITSTKLPEKTPSPIVTSDANTILNWKTYEDKSYKFKIFFPSNWLFATNTINKELDKYDELQQEDVVTFAETEINKSITYPYGRVAITKTEVTNETDIEKWFDMKHKERPSSPATGTEPVKEAVISTNSGLRVLKQESYFTNQRYYFILNKTVFLIDVNFANDDTGLNSPKNKSLINIYEQMIKSLSSAS